MRMTDLGWAALAGLAAGWVLASVLLRRAALDEARAQFDAWRMADVGRIRRVALNGARFGLKSRTGSGAMGPLVGLPFIAADCRFLGDPVAFVVFDGHSEVKDHAAEALREIVFVSVGDPRNPTDEAALVAECIARGNLRWETLTLDAQEASTSSTMPVATS